MSPMGEAGTKITRKDPESIIAIVLGAVALIYGVLTFPIKDLSVWDAFDLLPIVVGICFIIWGSKKLRSKS